MIKDFLTVKGSWRQRLFIYSLTVLLFFLFLWVLDFVLDDIRSMQKPELAAIEKAYFSQSLVTKQKNLQEELDKKNLLISQLTQQRAQIQESTKNAQISIKQLDEQQKLLLQYKKNLSDKETQFKNSNMELFQTNQIADQKLAQTIIDLNSKKQELTNELNNVSTILEKQREPARKAYDKALAKAVLIEAGIQILFLIVIIFIATYLLLRYRISQYKLLALAFFIAAIYETILILHNYFPSEYFKYILILTLIVIISKTLISMIKTAGSADPQVLLKRFRDAYSYFLCPTCEFPIRRGPMKFLYWTRRTMPKIGLGIKPLESSVDDEAYTCPVCSTELFSECKHCKKIRYSLLPTCPHCGEKSNIG